MRCLRSLETSSHRPVKAVPISASSFWLAFHGPSSSDGAQTSPGCAACSASSSLFL